MKKRKQPKQTKPLATAAPSPRSVRWLWIVAGLAGLFAAFEAYGPALRGPFVLDDRSLPFFVPGYEQAPLSSWLRGMRPLLTLTYWINFQWSATEPGSYHVVNVLLHFLNAAMIVLIVRKLIEPAPLAPLMRNALALFSGGLFLLHPLQTESVAYIAGRSESMAAFFGLAAWLVFLYRRQQEISWPLALLVALLCGAAVLAKEQTLVFPAVLLLTDLFWRGFAAARRNRRLYLLFFAGGAAGGVFVWRVLRGADTAGFGMKDLTWYQYFFTQCRAIWTYVRLFVFPVGLNADPDFPFSRTILDPAAAIGLLALLALTAAAWIYRKRYPYASFGWLLFLILLAPTSSFVPIRDPYAERRVYFPLVGLAIALLEPLRRWRGGHGWQALLAVILLACGFLTHSRSQVWSSPLALWQDTAAKSPNKARPRFQLAYALYEEGRCVEAVESFAMTARLQPLNYDLAVDWALALDCAGRPSEAIEKLRQAAAIEPRAHAFALMGMVYGKQRQAAAAFEALAQAEKIDPGFEMTYVYRGNVFAEQGDRARAASEYRRALGVNASNSAARDALARLGL